MKEPILLYSAEVDLQAGFERYDNRIEGLGGNSLNAILDLTAEPKSIEQRLQ